VLLDVAGRQAFRVERDHVAGQPIEAPLVLRHGDRLERAAAIARDPQLHLADLGPHRLVVGAVAGVTDPAGRRLATLVPEMLGHLHLEPGLKDVAHQIGQQAAFAGQRDAVLTSARDQLLGPLAHRRRCRDELTAPALLRRLTTIVLSHQCAPSCHRRSADSDQATPLTQSS
jgi:hypothetical protein